MSDPLSPVLASLRLSARVIYLGGVRGRWRLDSTGSAPVTFHLVTRGEGWLTSAADRSPRRITAGDLILYPRDAAHAVTGAPEGCDVVDLQWLTPVGEGDADVLCGAIDVGDGVRHPLLQALPEEVIVRARAGGGAAALAAMLQEEALGESPGRDALIGRLAEALFILAARECVGQPGAEGVLAGLADTRLRRALAAMHAEPARAWTLDALGRVAGMSRTAFAEAFHARVGSTAMDYLLRWRMLAATGLLRDEGLNVEQVAARVGYESVASFIRAFTRVYGVTPGKYVRGLR